MWAFPCHVSLMPRPGRCRFAAPFLGVVALVGLAACDDERSRESLARGSSATPSTPESPVAQAQVSAPSPAAGATSGRALYAKYCALCHGNSGEGYVADNAPSLVSKTFLESASDGFLKRAIRVGRPNTAMAAYGKQRGGPLAEPEIQAIVDFLRSLGGRYQPLQAYHVKGDPVRGKRLYEQHCQKCHGDEQSRGNALSLHNSELMASATSAFLKYAIVHGRPPTPMPAFGGVLSDQQIDDVLAWLEGLTPKTAEAPGG